MSVLSIRNRIEYAIIGLLVILTFGWLAYYMVQTEADTAGFASFITGMFGIAIGRQLIFFPPRESLSQWWKYNTTPGYYGIPWTGGVMRIIRPGPASNNIVFDLDGNCVGDEDYVHGKWHWHTIDSDCRYKMPIIALWLTRLRSPKLPKPQAEVLTADGDIVGHTDYMVR